jgi:hypothetical protein
MHYAPSDLEGYVQMGGEEGSIDNIRLYDKIVSIGGSDTDHYDRLDVVQGGDTQNGGTARLKELGTPIFMAVRTVEVCQPSVKIHYRSEVISDDMYEQLLSRSASYNGMHNSSVYSSLDSNLGRKQKNTNTKKIRLHLKTKTRKR